MSAVGTPGPSGTRSGRWVAAGTVLAILALALSVVHGAASSFQTSNLAPSGTFFALAASGNDLYAASQNGGSIILERSTDRGLHWTTSPVPYSLVAGGSPWTLASVSVDGPELLVGATTGGTVCPGPNPYPPYATSNVSCSVNSTLLMATSADGGLSWSLHTLVPPDVAISALDVGLASGGGEAISWLGVTTACCESTSVAGAVTSTDHGATWSDVQALAPTGSTVDGPAGIEMAPDDGGLDIAFEETPTGSSGSELNLERFVAPNGSAVQPAGTLAAPTSWTLQGSSVTPAYLLTPTYLIPLVRPPYTALPFDQLQSDGSGIGELPSVVSLAPQGHGVVEIAATTSDNLGVDCWTIDTTDATVGSSCHVELGLATSTAAASPLPIVALIDGGGWWTAIGSSGGSCPPDCSIPVSGGPPGYPVPVSAGSSSVGTSVCLTGCGASAGLVAYTYIGAPAGSEALLAVASGSVLLAGGLLVAVGILLARRPWVRRSPWIDSWSSAADRTLDNGSVADRNTRTAAQRLYRMALLAWGLSWTPVVALGFLVAPGEVPSVLPWAIVAAGTLGTVIGAGILWATRRLLRGVHGVDVTEELFSSGAPMAPRSIGERRLRSTLHLAYASYVLGGLALILLLFTAGPGESFLPSVGLLLAVISLLFLGFRIAYHTGLAGTVVATSPPGVSSAPVALGVERRTRLGALLLPFNPILGLVLGWSLGSVVPWNPAVVGWALLPVTLLGVAILLGAFGPTVWSGAMPPGGPSTFSIAGAQPIP